jgi:integrase
VRKGFFTDEEVQAVLRHLPDWYAPAIEFAWRTGWRSGEVKNLPWSQVDLRAKTVRLEPGTTKNREGRLFPFRDFPQLEVLLRRQRELTLDWQRQHGEIIPWVFWRNGHQLGDHRDSWLRACRLAGVPGRLVHDLRRSAVRNLERAGVPRSAAMKLTGHKTELIYRRYAIVSEADLGEATAKLSRFHAAAQAELSRSAREGSAKTDTKRAQSELREQFEAGSAPDDDSTASTGTHGRAVDSGAADFAAAFPATHPVDQAHWKL